MKAETFTDQCWKVRLTTYSQVGVSTKRRAKGIYRPILACLLLVFLPLSAQAVPPPSPAGGNYLVLDGDDDHAVLDFKTFGRPLLNGTQEFTVEAWVYPTTPPDKDTAGMILHQQVRMVIVNAEFPFVTHLANALNIEPPKGDFILLMSAYIEGKPGALRLPFPIRLEPNQWHHIAYQNLRV